MIAVDLASHTRDIVVEETFPHAAATLWKVLTDPDLMGRWLMKPTGFEPVVGNRFTFQTTPAGPWDGLIRCEVLEVVANERLAHSWKGGDEANTEYGSLLDTVVTWTLAQSEAGTRLRLVHSGFRPQNDFSFRNMSNGWPKVVRRVDELAAEEV
ncbi:SRPBCC domain-containing protein [Jiella endophytica]|uniref:SRPBCC domain-containing protein n=1 Tax=Jiella endophytica TaxID=2558362 RepID=A0A4Y8RU37_9HYPH|nr:SRPBCC domain-containing protein [Jiella endophytica]TFF27272.1 SRPBCC domain-containing protein [Jiella endophytica]